MTLKQAIKIDLLLSICKHKEDRVQIVTFKHLSKKLSNTSEKEFLRLIAIIRKEQLKMGTELIRGNSYSFKFFEPQITDLENLGGFKNIYWKNIKEILFKYLFPIATLGILIWSNFIKESDLKPKKEIEKSTKQIEPPIKDTIQTKKIDLKNLNEKENREHNLRTTTMEN
ncbi:hypothetical protein [Polaribacter sp. P097]|uniref:hypothetical protein n=1 Tax=Polaribacter sp. P097 TaxID=3117398 RepID=UPI002FE1EC8C